MCQQHHTERERGQQAVMTRNDFLMRAGAGLLTVTGGGSLARGGASQPLKVNADTGPGNAGVLRWDVITIGNLSRNRYWGEGDAQGVRSAICTCTLITGQDFRLLVDPSLSDAADMARELDRRTGLALQDVSDVFVTHKHGDHFAGIRHFPQAQWLAAPAVAEILNQTQRLPRSIEGSPGRLHKAVDVIPTPGHTHTHHSLRFHCEGLSIVVAGDAVPTQDFFRERRAYFNAVDFALSASTMDGIASQADIVVPGHDNFFLVKHP